MKKKNVLIVCITIFVILAFLSFIANYIDKGRVSTGHEPKLTIKIVSEDGKKVTYWGLGYKVVRYPSVSPNEPYKNNRGVKMGSWFMKYELDEEVNITLEDVNTKIIEYFSKENVDISNRGYNYVDEEAEVVVVGLIDNSPEKQDEFMHNVFSSCCGSTYIKYLQSKSMIKFVKTDPITTSNR